LTKSCIDSNKSMWTPRNTDQEPPVDLINLGKKKSITFDSRPAGDLAPAMKPIDLYRRNP